MKQLALALVAVSLPFGAHAAGCAKPRNAFDQVYCMSTQFVQTDRDLNAEYTRLRNTLPPAQQDALRHGQLAWIRQRDTTCSDEKQSGYFVNLQCAADMTQQRLTYLQQRERECTSTGCANANFGE
ncbi:lysozyme inhibitor LprI family protein [Paraburkholderia megapolitana]|jgi:uncharacterized protein YecT (DUF1311 family)|uniref:lysozyme inhibitor LprI family protein n=1 Tax=Paraburkholderia megapolitana TaxID=420953 RepID=UPI0038B77A4F